MGRVEGTLSLDVAEHAQGKRLSIAVLPRLHCSVYSQVRSHYCTARGLSPAPFPAWAGAPLLRRPGGPGLPQGHHIDTDLSADTRSA